MTHQKLNTLITSSEEPSFQLRLKESILKKYKTDIFQWLKPQMGGFIDEESVGISILSSEVKEQKSLEIKCSVFYVEKIGGCNCTDEPHAENGYCEMKFLWNEAGIKVIQD